MKCGNCGTENRQGVDECSQCGQPLFVQDRRRRQELQPVGARQLEEDLRTANWCVNKYSLEGRGDHETADAFVKRINEEVTPFVLREHQRIIDQRPSNNTAATKPREPGEDG